MKHSDQRPTSRHFDHHRFDAWRLAKEALIEGIAILNDVPRGYGKLVDQARRALSGACSSVRRQLEPATIAATA